MITKSIIKRFFAFVNCAKYVVGCPKRSNGCKLYLKSELMNIGKRRISAIGVVRLSKQVWRDMIMQSGATQVENREDG